MDLIKFLDEKRTKDCLSTIENVLKNKDETIEYLRKNNAKLRDKNFKDKTLVEMQREIDRLKAQLYNGFSITDNQKQKIDEWKATHVTEKHNGNEYAGAIGGRFIYEFTPTSIGTFGKIKCSCGEEFEFEDGKDF